MTILHIIESLDIGGAEVIFTESLKRMPAHYFHVVVYMRKPDILLKNVNASAVYCLGAEDKISFQYAIFKLRKIIKANRVDLIHSHLYWPTILARLSKSKKVPLVFTVHSCLGKSLFSKSLLHRYLEKVTYKKEQCPVFVSKVVQSDYNRYIGIKGRNTVQYNFAPDAFYEAVARKSNASSTCLHIVAVGNLRPEKNYPYILEVFNLLKNHSVYLDIYGDGPQLNLLRGLIEKYKLDKVTLKGKTMKPVATVPSYDAYILASYSEGFGIATVEAMAAGLPCILSDIEVNKEIASDAGWFFNLNSPQNCANKLLCLLKNKSMLSEMAEASRAKAEDYRIGNYIQKLDNLYQVILSK